MGGGWQTGGLQQGEIPGGETQCPGGRLGAAAPLGIKPRLGPRQPSTMCSPRACPPLPGRAKGPGALSCSWTASRPGPRERARGERPVAHGRPPCPWVEEAAAAPSRLEPSPPALFMTNKRGRKPCMCTKLPYKWLPVIMTFAAVWPGGEIMPALARPTQERGGRGPLRGWRAGPKALQAGAAGSLGPGGSGARARGSCTQPPGT